MTREVLRSGLEITESYELANPNFMVFQLNDKYLFSSAPDVVIQEEEVVGETDEDEWEGDGDWSNDDEDSEYEEWYDEEVEWDDEEYEDVEWEEVEYEDEDQ